MNSIIEVVVVIALVAGALAFIVVKAVKAFRSKRPSCCSGGANCPYCKKK
jgi:hypothetical protein